MGDLGTFTEQLDRICDELTGLCLQADQLRSVAPAGLAEMSNFHRLPEIILEVAADIAKQAQSIALLGEGLGDEDQGVAPSSP